MGGPVCCMELNSSQQPLMGGGEPSSYKFMETIGPSTDDPAWLCLCFGGGSVGTVDRMWLSTPKVPPLQRMKGSQVRELGGWQRQLCALNSGAAMQSDSPGLDRQMLAHQKVVLDDTLSVWRRSF